MSTLEETRDLSGAILLDDSNRYYRLNDKRKRIYGYHTHFTGAYVCYTCGHLCECEGGE